MIDPEIIKLLEEDYGIKMNPDVKIYINEHLCDENDIEIINCVREDQCYMSELCASGKGDIIEVYYNEVKQY